MKQAMSNPAILPTDWIAGFGIFEISAVWLKGV